MCATYNEEREGGDGTTDDRDGLTQLCVVNVMLLEGTRPSKHSGDLFGKVVPRVHPMLPRLDLGMGLHFMGLFMSQ